MAGEPHLEDANLAQGRLADLLVFVRLFEFFDRDDLPSLLVSGLEHDAVGPARAGAS